MTCAPFSYAPSPALLLYGRAGWTALTVTRLILLRLTHASFESMVMSARFDVVNRLPGVTTRHEPTTCRI